MRPGLGAADSPRRALWRLRRKPGAARPRGSRGLCFRRARAIHHAPSIIGHPLDRPPLPAVFVPLSFLLTPLLILAVGPSGAACAVAAVGIIPGLFGQVTVNGAVVGKDASDPWRAPAYAARDCLGCTAAGASVGLVAWAHEANGFSLLLQVLGVLCMLVTPGRLGPGWHVAVLMGFPVDRRRIGR